MGQLFSNLFLVQFRDKKNLKKSICGGTIWKEFRVCKFPADSTKYLQPMDLSVNCSIKNFYSQKWENYITSRIEKHLTKAGNIKPPTREDKVD